MTLRKYKMTLRRYSLAFSEKVVIISVRFCRKYRSIFRPGSNSIYQLYIQLHG
jgi:hypothetical protein